MMLSLVLELMDDEDSCERFDELVEVGERWRSVEVEGEADRADLGLCGVGH